MADATTVKVHTSTRDLIFQLGGARRQSADQLIVDALAALARDERRRVAAAEARAISAIRPIWPAGVLTPEERQ